MRKTTTFFLIILITGGVLVSCSLALRGITDTMAMEGNAMGATTSMPCCVLRPFFETTASLTQYVVPQTIRDLLFALLAVGTFLSISVVARVDPLALRNAPTALNALGAPPLYWALQGFERALHRGIIQPQLYEPAVALN